MFGWIAPPSPIIKRLMILNGVIFLAQWLAEFTDAGDFFQKYLALSGPGIEHFMVWQFVTYMFLHGGFWHILFNLLALWMFGRDVEYELGPSSFLKFYFVSGIVGGLTWLAFNFHSVALETGQAQFPYLMGASAGVYGVLIAFATLYPERPTTLVFYVFPVTLKAKYWAWLAVAAVIGATLFSAGGQVADLAHLGGIVVGYLYIKWLGYGATPGWMATIQRLAPSSTRSRRRDDDEFHSARPGVAYNHPYRTLEEEEKRSSKPKRVLGTVFSHRVSEPEPEEVDKDEYIQKEVDPILDKIAKQGMQSLTRRERKILESAKDKIDKRR